ncbi:MAG: insulinase family protein [Acidobacteria bacterium]|nr:insulinase family protein [Acidobacteriota bacterium]
MRKTIPILIAMVTAAAAPPFRLALTEYKLPNGLRVVLAPDGSSPIVTVGVCYKVGTRTEPNGHPGFAHLFEHLMFEGTANLSKMEFQRLIQSSGGYYNGTTRADHTSYYSVVPTHRLETILWVEADRMRGLLLTQASLASQQAIVGNEIRFSVLNRPYGSFPYRLLTRNAYTNWQNYHDSLGSVEEIAAAKLEDLKRFFEVWYVPNNAVLVVAGDFALADARKWIAQYFSSIPRKAVPLPPAVREPAMVEERRIRAVEKFGRQPAFAVGYRMPETGSAACFAMGLLDQLLVQKDDSWLHQELVLKRRMTSGVTGGIVPGRRFTCHGPALWVVSLIHERTTSSSEILSAIEGVVRRAQTDLAQPETILRAMTKLRSTLYSEMESSDGPGLADLLASLTLFDQGAVRIHTLERDFLKVTPQILRQTARDYLRPGNRTVVTLEPEQPQ